MGSRKISPSYTDQYTTMWSTVKYQSFVKSKESTEDSSNSRIGFFLGSLRHRGSGTDKNDDNSSRHWLSHQEKSVPW